MKNLKDFEHWLIGLLIIVICIPFIIIAVVTATIVYLVSKVINFPR